MTNVIMFVAILSFAILVKYISPGESLGNTAAYALGLLMLVGYLSGKTVKKIKFPAITGYILAGILVGPYGISLVTAVNIEDLQLLNGLALSLIALNAGGEIKYSGLKKNFKTIGFILLFQVVFIIVGIILTVMVVEYFFPFFGSNDTAAGIRTLIAAGLLMGIIACASAPSTTLAVIVESKIKNRYTELTLSIVLLKDILILFLFVIGLGISRPLVGGTGFAVSKILFLFLEVIGSIACGIAIGAIIVFYLKRQARNSIVFILGISFFSYEIFEPLHLHPLLIMMTAGFVVENFSSRGKKLIATLETISPPVYTIFFCLIGASIKISFLKSFFFLTLIFVCARLLFKYLGTFVGGLSVGEDNMIKKNAWMAYISQAGVSLGMAKIIESNLGVLGGKLFTLIVSVIVINEIIGPLLLKYFVIKSNKKVENVETTPHKTQIQNTWTVQNTYSP